MNSSQKYTLNQKPKRSSKKPWLLALVALLLLCGVVAALELTNTTYLFHDRPKGVAGNSYTKGQGDASKTQSSAQTTTKSGATGTNTDQNTGTSAAPPLNGKLQAPQGTFANIYTAGPDEQMGSTCNTTPGATCQILFTKDGVTKSLPVENTDEGGAVFWSWTPKKIGLTPGTWHITAKATLGAQVKTTSNDPLTLEITT